MGDPVTMAIVGGSVLTSFSSIKAGQAAKKAGQAQAAASREQAAATDRAAEATRQAAAAEADRAEMEQKRQEYLASKERRQQYRELRKTRAAAQQQAVAGGTNLSSGSLSGLGIMGTQAGANVAHLNTLQSYAQGMGELMTQKATFLGQADMFRMQGQAAYMRGQGQAAAYQGQASMWGSFGNVGSAISSGAGAFA